MAVWTTKYINSLPDSSFAWIDPQGGRHLPYKDANGNVDAAHTRNALARLNQVAGLSGSDADKVKAKLQNALGKVNNDIIENGTFILDKVELDADGNVPYRIQVMETGEWPDSVKGDFSISLDDLNQIKSNFDKGVGFPTEDASTGLAIDFMHNYDEEAAGWIKGLEIVPDRNDPAQGKLFANPVEWSDAGAEAVKTGKFKMISPSGYFGSKNGKQMSMWSNPRNLKEKVANVLDGAGLTNIPFLRGMSPIRADRTSQDASAYDNVIYVVSNQHKKESSMNLDSLRVKEPTDLSGEEYQFLAQHKEELSADDQKRFSLEVPEAQNAEDEIPEEDKALLASIRAGEKEVVDKGKVDGDKERLDRMESTIEGYRKQDVQDTLDKHVARGAIKQDQAKLDGFWAKQLLSATTDEDRQTVKDALEALPDNEDIASELGHAGDETAGSTARDQLATIAGEKVAAAAKDGKELLYADALKQAIRENSELTKQDKIEQGVA